jgi:hypothetical protein
MSSFYGGLTLGIENNAGAVILVLACQISMELCGADTMPLMQLRTAGTYPST